MSEQGRVDVLVAADRNDAHRHQHEHPELSGHRVVLVDDAWGARGLRVGEYVVTPLALRDRRLSAALRELRAAQRRP